MRIDSSGNVGIGTTSPDSFNVDARNLVVGTGSGDQGISIYAGSSSDSSIFFVDGTSGTSQYRGQIRYRHGVDSMSFLTSGGQERMRIDSSGRVMIGTTTNANVSNNADELIVGNNTSATETGITLGSTLGSTIRFNDGADAGSIEYGHSSNYMRFSTANSERMRIDSSGNVGIGETTPQNKLSVGSVSDANTAISINCTSSGFGTLRFNDDASESGQGRLFYDHTNNAMGFTVNSTERMRIDSSGNLLVGKTSSDEGVAGHELREGSFAAHTVSGNLCLNLRRLSSDGDILRFQKDGTTVGSIGAVSGDMYIGTGDTGLRFHDGNNVVYPANQGAVVDANLDIGDANYRWKDLFLSGGVYLGGVGSSNKLDDYEEGVSNPTLTGSTSGTKAGYGTYAKVGSLVMYQFTFNAIGTGLSGNLTFEVPFVNQASNNTAQVYFPVQVYDADWPASAKALYGYLNYNDQTVNLNWSVDDGGSINMTGSNVDSASCYIRGTIVYRTDS
jgi:hypothetical protein